MGIRVRHSEPVGNSQGGGAPTPSNSSFAIRARNIPADWPPLAALVLSLAYYYAVPAPLLALPGLLAFLGLTWLRLDLALCVLPLTFPFWFVPKHIGGNVVFPLSEIALAVCFAVALVREARSLIRRPPVRAALTKTRVGQPARTAEAAGPHCATPGEEEASGRLLRVAAALTSLLARLGRTGAPVLIGAALLLAGTALGVVIARRPHEALRAFRWEVVEPLLYAALVLVYLRGRHVRLLVGAFLGAALLLATLAAIQVFWLHVTFLPVAQGNRLIPYAAPEGAAARATAFIFGSGNTLGAWMARALPLALALGLAPRGMARRWRLLSLVVTVASIPALLWSDSRGALIAAALACAVVGVLSLPRPRWAIGVSVAGALVALVALLANRAAVLNALLTGHGGSGEVRTLVWLAGWHMIRDHVLLGIGPDQFLYYYSNLYTRHPYWILFQNGHRTLAWTEPNLAQPHNLVLDLWLSGGILALAGFAVVLAAFWRGCWLVGRAARIQAATSSLDAASEGLQPAPARAPVILGRDSAAWSAALALGLGASVLAGVLHGMVDSAYFEPDLALLFWWAIASLVLTVGS